MTINRIRKMSTTPVQRYAKDSESLPMKFRVQKTDVVSQFRREDTFTLGPPR